MRGLVRLLVMFGPMIMNQVTRYQRNKQRRQPQQRPQQYPRQRGMEQPDLGGRRGAPPQQQPPQQKVYKDLNKELGRDGRGRAVSAEERDFNLKEEDIMLTKDDLKHFEENNRKVEQLDDVSLDQATEKTKKTPSEPVEDDSDYDEFFES